jgi:hypothetical protein
MLLEWTMQINCRPARLGIVNLSKMNKVKGKKERKKERKRRWTFLKVYFVLLLNGQKTPPPFFSIYEQSPFFYIFPIFFVSFSAGYYYMVSAAAVGRFSLSSSNVFSFWVNLLLLLFITPQMNQKLFQGWTYISI